MRDMYPLDFGWELVSLTMDPTRRYYSRVSALNLPEGCLVKTTTLIGDNFQETTLYVANTGFLPPDGSHKGPVEFITLRSK